TYFLSSQSKPKPFCIVGAKACDLVSLYIQDYCFLTEPTDEHYQYFRNNNFIISSDCTDFKEACFCLALGINPYPEVFFDLNISDVGNGYLVKLGSEKGEKTTEECKDYFQEAQKSLILQQNTMRQDLIGKLSLHIDKLEFPRNQNLYELIKKNYTNDIWQQESLRCVECGACIMNCPTCHCFLLFDEKENSQFIRARTWDGCQYKNFVRVAGGANPLKFRAQRLRNRYIKKFDFFYQRISRYACTGCGRCVESCIAKIDIREIFKTIAKSTLNV
ncbi:MAG: 4Fe-4S dicluster domain-containing protein, partial [Candidatus Omnitrophica bacterium]|nr:4Fe-4S dicluster domain-containing protein [Candidatus Omnitrophota bacterium]